jgi:hypothetical protein
MRPQERRLECLRIYPTMRNWEIFGPFDSREDGEAWEGQQLCCEWSRADPDPKTPGAKWWGYHFDL